MVVFSRSVRLIARFVQEKPYYPYSTYIQAAIFPDKNPQILHVTDGSVTGPLDTGQVHLLDQ